MNAGHLLGPEVVEVPEKRSTRTSSGDLAALAAGLVTGGSVSGPGGHLDQVYVDLYWIPLGAGGWFVKRNGRLYEAVAARHDGRAPLDLYHSALEVAVPEGRFVLEQAPVPRGRAGERGVVAEGPVGLRAAGRLRVFRYEVRCWRGGRIPDVAEAVDSPRRLTADARLAHRVLRLAPEVPTPVWGRDELGTGDMWNSNAVISWLLTRAGFDPHGIPLPPGGRAPGWEAGIAAARRDLVGPGLCPRRPRGLSRLGGAEGIASRISRTGETR